ncbi:MAG TPA: hypothetical protein VF723_05470 [Pyrinomonadaceae bacterium]
MKKLIACLLGLLFLASAMAAGAEGGKWLNYRGAWFDIKYPAGFKVRPSQPSTTSSAGYDGVFFRSPDATVEFYVFSPQWNGEPAGIRLKPASEAYVSQNEEEKDGKKIRRATIRAKNGSYLRSYEDIEDASTRRTFGIKYRDQAAYERYRQDYLTFKQSLTQYAD